MKNFLGTFILLFIVFTASAQNNLNGIVTDNNNQPLKGATVIISTKKFKSRTQTDEQGQI